MIAETANADHRTVQARLSALFSEVMQVEVPSVETDLFDTGILDSQMFVELLLHIEQSFHMQINIEDFKMENFRCIGQIASLILQQKGGGGTAQASQAGAS
jgi:acyl carrier protein